MKNLLSVPRTIVPWILAICSTITAQQGWVQVVGPDGSLVPMDSATETMWSSPFWTSQCGAPYCLSRDQALAYAAQLNQGGYTDWRVPSKKELEKACADGGYAALLAFYPNGDWVHSLWSTSFQGKKFPWFFYFSNCSSQAVGPNSTAAVICARGPEYTGKGGGRRGGGKGNSLTGGGGSSTEYYGIATSGCHGVPSIDSKGEPLAGTRQFAITCSDAPRNSSGVLLLSFARASILVPGLRLRLLVDPSALAISHVVRADGKGLHKTELPLPPGARGAAFFGQFLWLDPSCSTQPLSASMGLAVCVQ